MSSVLLLHHLTPCWINLMLLHHLGYHLLLILHPWLVNILLMSLHSSIIKSVNSCICTRVKASHPRIHPLALTIIALHLQCLAIFSFMSRYFNIVRWYLFTYLHLQILVLDLALRTLFGAIEASSLNTTLILSAMILLLLILVHAPNNHMLSLILLVEIRHSTLSYIDIRKPITIVFVEVLFMCSEILLHYWLPYIISLLRCLSLFLSLQRRTFWFNFVFINYWCLFIDHLI